MSRLQTSFVLGYHGCDKDVGMKAVNGEIDILHSEGEFDWLGTGSYFWESDKQRALEWAKQKAGRGDYSEPFVVGAAIDLGNCLDLLRREDIELVRTAYDSFVEVCKASDIELPKNRKARQDSSPDQVLRYLDCAVIDHLHKVIEAGDGPLKIEPFDTVRGLFTEGKPLYDGGGFKDKTHSQIAVRNMGCIKGVFIPR